LDLEPNQPELAMELAWLNATAPEHLRDPHRALPFARRATELAPDEPLCWTTLALVEYRMGRWSAAAAAARHSIRLHPEGAAAYDWLILAMCDQRVGRPESARENLERANRRIADHAGPDTSAEADFRALRTEAEALLRGTDDRNSNDH
jgi:tetratricopeptide (TPR) repeat protein